MMRLRAPTTMLISCTLMACAAAVQNNNKALVIQNGLYEFSEHPPGTSEEFRGTMRVFGDSVDVMSTSHVCKQVRRNDPHDAFSFGCGTISLNASNRTGRWLFNYRTSRTESYETTVCAQYEMKDGKQYCARNKQEHHERVVPITAQIYPVLIDSTPVGRTSP